MVQNISGSKYMFNTIIRGSSGTGKTQLAKIIGDIIISLKYLYAAKFAPLCACPLVIRRG